ncbi:CoA transferase subunit A [Falsiporphyromonas endometrii]|uniref:CoA transferase subunit A n=1 Tax=Falsiporphyromonas endometrii TaxID=1387297 RepID=A0ABV9K7T8_9PORP|nr:CoA transferase subunit A [Porphyromonadaceae bacterium]
MKKAIKPAELAAKFKDGMTIMIGGFLGNGTPERIVDELVKSGVKDLTLISNDTSYPDRGCGRLIANHQVKKLIASHIGTNKMTGEQMNNKELEVEFSPQGTLAERIRVGGSGLGGVLTRTGIGTVIEEGKEKVTVDGVEYLLEKPLRADFAFIKGNIGDEFGNLVYLGTTKNFQPMMAMAADTVVAEIDKIVPQGEIEPHEVHTSGIFVDYILE